MRKTQTLKRKGKEREKKTCGCQNKGVDKDHIAFFKKRRIINDVTLPQRVYIHTHITFPALYSEKHYNLTGITVVNIEVTARLLI